MACRDVEVLWRKDFMDPSQCQDFGHSKIGPRSPDFSQNLTEEQGWHNPPWVREDLRSSRFQDGEPPVWKTRRHDLVLKVPLDFQDHPSILHFIKTCGKQRDLRNGSRIHAQILEKGLLEKDITLGNALLTMYAKCDALAKAQEMFDQLPARDVVTWNALIAGYTQHGLGDEALRCFAQMHSEGFSPDAVTFTCVFRACVSIGSPNKGEEIHAEVSRLGLLGKDIVLGNALVDMYAKCGMLAKAHGVFDKLPARDVVTWNALIAGYAQHGLNDEALRFFEKMQDEGLSPSAVTFTCILNVCGRIGAEKKGDEIHAKVSMQGLQEKDIVLGNALVDMYAKCGALGKAQGVFNKLSARNIITWNALIAGYAQYGLGDEALSCFRQMRDAGFFPDAVTFVCILRACGTIRAVEKGEEIHAEASRQGLLEKDNVLGTALVDMYAKCGALAKAHRVFDELPARDVVTWNVLLDGYAQHGLADEALNFFGQMQDEGLSPNAVTFACTLKACGSIRAVEKGEEIHAEVGRQGLLEKDNVLGTALVDMYAKCGELAKAQGVFKELPARDAVTWNALIAGYAQYGLGDEALNCFERMRDEGHSPNAVTFVCILKACGSTGFAEKGAEIHAEVSNKGLLEKDTMVGNALVDMYAKCGAFGKAQSVFDKLPARNVVTWNALIAGYAQHGLSNEALSCFEGMRDEGLSPNAITFACMLQVCGSIGAAQKGEEMHTEVGRQGLLEKDNVLGLALVDMYAKCGTLAKAQEVFDGLQSLNVVLWNALIAGYAQVGRVKMVFDSFIEMVGKGIEPDAVTFIALLTACSHAGLVEEGQMYFDTISTVYCIIPTLEHHTCMVDILSRAGLFVEAISVIEKVPPADCLLLWLALMAACRNGENVQIGRCAFEQLVQLNEEFASAYVCMGNIYAAAGMQVEMDEVDT